MKYKTCYRKLYYNYLLIKKIVEGGMDMKEEGTKKEIVTPKKEKEKLPGGKFHQQMERHNFFSKG